MPVLRSLVYHMLRAYINTQPNCTLLEGPTEATCVKDQPAGKSNVMITIMIVNA